MDDIIPKYGKVWALGNRNINNIWNGPVVVEEKVDGSLFRFALSNEGILSFGSKNVAIDANDPEPLFKKAVEHVKSVAYKLLPEVVYFAEAITSPKHNTLAYNRTPSGCIVLFDVLHCGIWMDPPRKALEATYLGMESTPLLFYGTIPQTDVGPLEPGSLPSTNNAGGQRGVGPGGPNVEAFVRGFLERESFLGGPKIEGVVVKNYGAPALEPFAREHDFAKGKFVRPEFKEENNANWKLQKGSTILEQIVEIYRTDARWNKSIQALRDGGQLLGEPKDLALLIPAIATDVRDECEAEIRDLLWAHYWPQIARQLPKGLADYYKGKLLDGSI